jgi:hypothetical protein
MVEGESVWRSERDVDLVSIPGISTGQVRSLSVCSNPLGTGVEF